MQPAGGNKQICFEILETFVPAAGWSLPPRRTSAMYSSRDSSGHPVITPHPKDDGNHSRVKWAQYCTITNHPLSLKCTCLLFPSWFSICLSTALPGPEYVKIEWCFFYSYCIADCGPAGSPSRFENLPPGFRSIQNRRKQKKSKKLPTFCVFCKVSCHGE